MGQPVPKRRLETPIAFPPREGPIYAAWQCMSRDASEPDDPHPSSARAAARLWHDASFHSNGNDPIERPPQPLQSWTRPDGASASTTPTSPVWEIHGLLQTLSRARHIHEQLQTLQAYRSKILQRKVPPATNQVVESPPSEQYLVCLARLLLEWMLAVETPVSLRRAIASCLVAVMDCVDHAPDANEKGSTTTALSIMWDSVVESIASCPLTQNGTETSVLWIHPLHSLQEALSWIPLERYMVQQHVRTGGSHGSLLVRVLSFLRHHTQSTAGCQTDDETHVHCVHLANLVNKTLLLSMSASSIPVSCHDDVSCIQEYLWDCLVRTVMPADGWSTVAIAYGRTLQWQWQSTGTHETDPSTTGLVAVEWRDAAVATVRDRLARAHADIAIELNRAAVYQGLTSVVPLPSANTSTDASEVIASLMGECHALLIQASDPDVRLSALKSIRSLVSRISTWNDDLGKEIVDQTAEVELPSCRTLFRLSNDWIRPIVTKTLEVVLQAWENPPNRKLANAIPPLFESLVQTFLSLNSSATGASSGSLDDLVQRLLTQPKHRKGRYLALETLLPVIGAKPLIRLSPTLLPDLLNGMADNGSNTAVIASLWAKLLYHLRVEIVKDESPTVETNGAYEISGQTEQWLNVWIPSLAVSLVELELTRRKRVAAFCLPRISTMVDAAAKDAAVMATLTTRVAFSALVQRVASLRSEQSNRRFDPLSNQRETIWDRFLWAELEVVRYASYDGLMKSSTGLPETFRSLIPALIPQERLKWALTHFSPPIRVAALQVIEFIAPLYGHATDGPLAHLEQELDQWKYALPFLVKEDGKEHVTSVLHCLLLCLDRLSLQEASALEHSSLNSSPSRLPILTEFVENFLIADIVLLKAGYPGTVAKKESFVISLLESLIVFSCREHPLALDSKLMPKSGAIYRRRRLDAEIASLVDIQKALLSREVFAALLSLLQSNWDNTRIRAYQVLVNLVQLSDLSSLSIPEEYTHSAACTAMEFRGIYLASSPRQREADSGTRLLGFLFRCLLSASDKIEFLRRLVSLLGMRLVEMKEKLAAILTHESDILGGRELPLAHGIIHALRLMIENDVLLDAVDRETGGDLKTLLKTMCSYFFQALRVSLAVVADVTEGEIVEGMEEIALTSGNSNQERYTKAINPGAIGANGIFSSVDRSTEDEKARQQASQRIVVGSWLLTKETCGALAALLASSCFRAELSIFNEAGTLLISTLTSLKHTGAAFAAHRAIESIAVVALKQPSGSSMHNLLTSWSERLLAEVSKCEKIRDSTLRRSTGYALGFVALMKAESSTRSQRLLCNHLLTTLLQLCMPSESHAESFMDKIELSGDDRISLLQSFCKGSQFAFVSDCDYNVRPRVHALNSLRAILLDASLSREVFPFVGVAIVASVMGYMDSEWSVRNSSTMVFAAAMVRSIDPDKNASNKDITSSNALSAQELFQAYPTLAAFLLSVLDCGVKGKFQDSNLGMSLPPVLPILLLLTRLQAASQSGMDSVALLEPFIPAVLNCLGDKHISIRKGASRALRNLSSMARHSTTSIQSLLLHCQNNMASSTSDDWNQVHGSLLAILELVQDTETTKGHLQESETLGLLRRMTTVAGGARVIPPICVAVAIQILSIVEDKDTLLNRCTGILSWLESTEDIVGGSELAVTVSSAATKVVSSIVWDASCATSEKGPYFESLSAMFCSRLVDVRIAAVKAFKKDIYKGIDGLVTSQSCEYVTDKVGTILLSSISNELREKESTHPPTLRRLLRCLLEILACGISSRTTEQRREFLITCQRLATLILARDNVLDVTNNGGLTSLHGYCEELLSLCLLQQPATERTDTDLASLVSHLGDPSVHWRMRHSTAVALKGHDLLSKDPRSLALLGAWISGMQDEDADVRYAAAKVHDTEQGRGHVENVTSELFLIREFTAMGVANSSSASWMLFLVSTAMKSTDGLKQMGLAVNELNASVDPKGTPTSQSESRNIFEAEQPNAYLEVSLIGQLCALELSAVSPQNRAELTHLCHTLMDRVHSVLTLVGSQSRSSAHISVDVTRTHHVFAPLHSLLISVVATIYARLTVDPLSVQELARTIVAEGGTVHPAVGAAMQALAVAQPGDAATLKSLQQCCFLLPGCAMT